MNYPNMMNLKGWQSTKRSNITFSVDGWFKRIHKIFPDLTNETLSSIWALLCHVSGKNHETLAAHPEIELSESQVEQTDFLLEKLLSGFPLAYLIERQSFYNLDFYVNPNVLIPRPETELLVDQAIEWLENHPLCKFAADIGTGSGCIAVSLAKESINLNIIATDISFAALEVAKQNITKHKVSDKTSLVQSDLLNGIETRFGLICANLPYIPTAKLRTLSVRQYEPQLALDGGWDGLKFIKRMIINAPNYLSETGLLLLEIEHEQETAVTHLTHQNFPNAKIKILHDLAGFPRLLSIEQNPI